MRHKKNFNHLGRKSAHRKAMLANMASSLIVHKRIKTTTAKAKALKRYIEPLITKSKEDTTHSRRVVFAELQDKAAVAELFRDVASKVGDRPGGYTRIIKLGDTRVGDSADMCFIELVDFNENLLAEKESAKKSSRRRRGSKKPVAAPATEGTNAEAETTAEVSEADGGETVTPEEEAPEAVSETAEEPAEEAAPEEENSPEDASDDTTKEKEA